jgi:hypothetical protein
VWATFFSVTQVNIIFFNGIQVKPSLRITPRRLFVFSENIYTDR